MHFYTLCEDPHYKCRDQEFVRGYFYKRINVRQLARVLGESDFVDSVLLNNYLADCVITSISGHTIILTAAGAITILNVKSVEEAKTICNYVHNICFTINCYE